MRFLPRRVFFFHFFLRYVDNWSVVLLLLDEAHAQRNNVFLFVFFSFFFRDWGFDWKMQVKVYDTKYVTVCTSPVSVSLMHACFWLVEETLHQNTCSQSHALLPACALRSGAQATSQVWRPLLSTRNIDQYFTHEFICWWVPQCNNHPEGCK